MSNEEKKEESAEEKIAKIKEEDLQKRVQAFNSELIPLLQKYKLGLGGSAFLMPDGRVGARPQLFDDPAKPTEKGVESPYNKDADIDLPTAV